ncbi:nuclear transport factor 2 family protein [Verrucomicrobiaceae bacterium R5-34]|uniref:Nuclear transport factor 2 family protein n=1 Tax=Oceaniferula flava TaxID=2800421 RepID=A0AAE2SEF4_9BACT|nr:nuclear transport factor 2 family protein [Oceaniferula flavus]MBK1831230.1 nuclear transport factor 2 family protein [Verrucomicrobiaceae bacterium R5-34]MBK1855399.1 nuclear transport factor 2 family protein [Oceaniferula flavus]MBM1136705.1 nuclear transport factor 2 family protein [Oceaniferula flavus]
MDSKIAELAQQQLSAYNDHNLDAFVKCYHEEIEVLNADGKVTTRGRDAFRKNYEAMFARGNFGATVEQRLVHGEHCVDLEHWHRFVKGEESRGTVLVRYRLRDNLIGTVQFLK